jgi:hypothetical protein
MPDDATPAIEPQAEPGDSATPTDATGGAEPAPAVEGAESAPAGEAPEPTAEQGADPSGKTKPSGAEQRIKHLVTDRDTWRDRAIAAGFKPPDEKPVPSRSAEGELQPPRPGDYYTVGEFEEARTAYLDKLQDRKLDARLADREQEKDQQARLGTFTSRISKAGEADPQVPEAAHAVITAAMNNPGPGSQALVQGLVESDHAEAMAKHLYANPREAARIASLPLNRAFMEMGRLEAKLSAVPATTKKTTTAPAPITPVGTGGGGSRDIGDPKLSSEERIGALRKARAGT